MSFEAAGSVNKQILLGNISSEIKSTKIPNTNTTVATFSLVTNRKWTDSNDVKHEEANFHNIVARWPQAENIVKFNKKGSKLYIEGYSKTRDWVSKTDNIKRYTTEVIVEHVVFLNNKSDTVRTDVVEIEDIPNEILNNE